jgi:glutamate-1-semialdehyde 2,1-aminomutase
MKSATIKETDRSASLSLQEKGKKLIPGLSQLLSKRPDQFAPGVWPGYFSRAKGVEVWDLDDNRYIDMSIGGIGANVLGYADPDVDRAVIAAVAAGSSSSLNCPEEVELAELLCTIHPWADMVRFARTGGESMAIAVRIARAATGRDKVTFCGYHGWHDWYLAANLGTENALGEHLLPGLAPTGVPAGLAGTALPFRYNQIEELKTIVAKHGSQLAAIIMEPIRSEWPRDGFFDQVRKLADECGAVFVLDEISAGFRMNSGGAHLKLGITPDMAVFSKAMGNGYPIAAVIGTAKVMEAAQTTFISSTCWTERIGPTAALATIRKHQQLDAGPHLMAIGRQVQEGWQELSTRHDVPLHIGGIPPLSHFAFETDLPQAVKALWVQLMLDRGFLATTSFYSMAAHTEEHVRAYIDAADEVFCEIAQRLQSSSVEAGLKGKPATAGFKRLA